MSTRSPPAPPGHPVVGHTIDYARDMLGFVDRAVDAVGDVVRVDVLGEGEFYVLAHPDYVERALMEDRDAFRKSEGFAVAFGDSVLTVEGDTWEHQRELLDEFFYPGRIQSYVDEMVRLTERRLDRWSDGRRVALHDQMKSLALENLFATVFDRPLDPDADDELYRAADGLNAWFKPTSWALPRWVPTPARRRFRRARETLDAEARRLLAERQRAIDVAESEGNSDDRHPDDAPGDDLLSTLVAQRAAGDADLSDDAIVDQVIGITFAGHDTTALAMTYAWHLLGTHPEVRERFHAELDEVLDGPPTPADVADLEVTRNVVREAIRLYPPVHTVPRKTARAVDVGGCRLSSDARAHLSIYRIHRDPRFWDDPADFRPDRWRDIDPQATGHAYAPFGAGPRICLGRRFALLEATLVLATAGRRYRVEPLSELELAPQMTTQPADAVPVEIVER